MAGKIVAVHAATLILFSLPAALLAESDTFLASPGEPHFTTSPYMGYGMLAGPTTPPRIEDPGRFQAEPVTSEDRQHCDSRKLSYRPYSSSYLPRSVGPLTTKHESKANLRLKQITPGQAASFTRLTLMQRFDELNFSVLGKSTNYQKAIDKDYRDPKDADWTGYCDQWSAASLDPSVNKVVNETGDLVCRDVVLSQGDLKELFTGFYKPSSTMMIGQRVDKYYPNMKAVLANSGGWHTLSAYDFDSVLTDNLKNDRGVVINLTPAEEVWNQPVYGNYRCETPFKLDDSNVMHLPADLLTSGDAKISTFLSALAISDTNLISTMSTPDGRYYSLEANRLQTSLADLKTSVQGLAAKDPAWKKLEARLNKSLGMKKIDYAQTRALSQEFIKQLAADKMVSVRPDVSISQVSNFVNYAEEVDFGSPKSDSGHKAYRYALATDKQGRIIDSFWLTPMKDRPGSIWVPDPSAPDKITPALKDLLAILDKCKADPTFQNRNRVALKEAANTAARR